LVSSEEDNGQMDTQGSYPTILKEELLNAWQSENVHRIYAVLAKLQPYIFRSIRSKFHQLDDADVEDCISSAYESFYPIIERCDSVPRPYSYFYKIVENKALDYFRHPENGHTPLTDDQIFITSDMVNELIGDIEPEPQWVPALKEAIERLSPKLRAVMHCIMKHGLDTKSNEAKNVLNLEPAAFRMAKKRALEKLRLIFPAVIEEWGIEPPRQVEPSVFHENTEFPSDD